MIETQATDRGGKHACKFKIIFTHKFVRNINSVCLT